MKGFFKWLIGSNGKQVARRLIGAALVPPLTLLVDAKLLDGVVVQALLSLFV